MSADRDSVEQLIAEMTDSTNPPLMMRGVGVGCGVVAGWRDRVVALLARCEAAEAENEQLKADIENNAYETKEAMERSCYREGDS